MLLENWVVSAKKLCWNPHDDVTKRRSISFLFLQQQTDKNSSMLAANF